MSGTNIYGQSNAQVSVGNNPQVPQVYTFPVVLLSGATLDIDLKPLANTHRMQNVQGVFLDNSLGSTALALTTTAGQNIVIPAGGQAVMPLYLSAIGTITLTGTGEVNITLLNFPTPACVWGASGQVVTISGTVQVQDLVTEQRLATIQNQAVALSASVVGTVAAASTSLMAANPARQYLFIQSPYNVAGSIFHDLWINPIGGTAGVGLVDCIKIPAGGSYESGYKVWTGLINYYDAVGGNNLTALQG